MDDLGWAIVAGLVIVLLVGFWMMGLFERPPEPARAPVMRNAGPDVIYREE